MPTAERPYLVGDGPVTCSTSQVVDLVPIWDVNGYYADLGVGTRATKGQIAKRYRAVGTTSARLTYVVKQLLNREVRRAYDACPLGSVFLDEEVLAHIRRARAKAVSEAGDTVAESQGEPPQAVLDTVPVAVQDSISPDVWGYAHYQWESLPADQERLRQWQTAVVSAASAHGVTVQIAVGSSGGTRPPVEVTVVGTRIVVFLHEQHGMTDALVQQAVSPLVELVEHLRDRKISWHFVPAPTQRRKPRRAATSRRTTTSVSKTERRPSSGS